MKTSKNNGQARLPNSGQAALLAVFLLTGVILSAAWGAAALALRESRVSEGNTKSRKAFFAAESGVEDATYRSIRGKAVTSSFSISLNGSSAITTVSDAGGTRTINSEGESALSVRGLAATLKEDTTATAFHYGVQVGDGGLVMQNNSTITGNVYSNGSIVGAQGAKVTGDVIAAGGINDNPSITWITHDADYAFASASSNQGIAQSFVATESGALNRVAVYLGKVGSPSSNLTTHITADNGGKPNYSDLASAVLSPSVVGGSPSWINIAFASPVTVSSSTKYWIVLDYGNNSGSNYWNWRKDTSDAYTNNTGRYTSNWSSKSASWTNVGGDLAFKAWIGGSNHTIDSVTIGDASSGTGRANQFTSSTVHGSSCPNQYCIVENPARAEFPISDGVIVDWKNDAAAGGVINGDYSLANNASLGPQKITGDLLMTANNKTLTVTGTIYVQGNISIDNGSTIQCAVAYGANSCVIISDGWIHIKNNGLFGGSGNPASFIMLVSTASCDGVSLVPPCDAAHHNGSIDLHNGADGAIFYAPHGLLNMHNGVGIQEATAYKISLDQTASVSYVSGLANLNFSSGPSGGWGIESWQEVAP